MKQTFIETECRDKVSPNCTKVFLRKIQRGRPQVNCEACKNFTPTKAAARASKAVQVVFDAPVVERECPCGKKFTINPGRGRKATKCGDCRAAGIVYREDENGDLQTILAEALAEEQREIREENGRQRAERLFNMMQPLLSDKRERKVIVH